MLFTFWMSFTKTCSAHFARSTCLPRGLYTGWAKTSKPVKSRHLKAHIFCLYFQNAWTNFYDFWHTSTRFILNASIYSVFLKFIIQSGATWQNLITSTLLSQMLRGVQCNLFSRSNLDKLLNKIDCSNILKDGKIEAVHDVLKQQQALYLLAVWSPDCTKAWQKVSRAWSISEWWRHISNAFCMKTMDRSNRFLNDTMCSWSRFLLHMDRARKQERINKVTFNCYNNWITSFCLFPGGITLY